MSKGRGRGSSSRAMIDALGIKNRDAIPAPILHPPPLFPPMEKKPLELKNDEASSSLLLIQQEWCQRMRQSPFYLKPVLKTGSNSIVKYSDRYKTATTNDLTELLNNIPNWKTFMPKELHFVKRKKTVPTSAKPKNQTASKLEQTGEIGDKLKQLEEKEGVVTIIESEDDERLTEDEHYDEEVEEEAGDYNQTYFDPGDEFALDEEDALDDGPSY